MIFTREESQIASSPRHEMEVSVRVALTGMERSGPLTFIHYPIRAPMENMDRQQLPLSGHKSIGFISKYRGIYVLDMM